jgi:hypothetical protein
VGVSHVPRLGDLSKLITSLIESLARASGTTFVVNINPWRVGTISTVIFLDCHRRKQSEVVLCCLTGCKKVIVLWPINNITTLQTITSS